MDIRQDSFPPPRTTGRRRACSCWNCSINTYCNLLFSCWFMVHTPHKVWHCVKCACGNRCQHSQHVTSFLAIHFHRLTWSFVFVFLICGGSNFGEESVWNESVIWSDFGNKFYKWELRLRFWWENMLSGWKICRNMNLSCLLARNFF